jgi:hypothetical protein
MTQGQLDRYRQTQESTMYDSCVIHKRTDTTDRYNRAEAHYTPAAEGTICGFDPTGGDEVQAGAEVLLSDAALRLPYGTDVAGDDGIEVTHRWHQALSPTLKFYILGPPQIGPTGIVLNLQSQVDNRF